MSSSEAPKPAPPSVSLNPIRIFQQTSFGTKLMIGGMVVTFLAALFFNLYSTSRTIEYQKDGQNQRLVEIGTRGIKLSDLWEGGVVFACYFLVLMSIERSQSKRHMFATVASWNLVVLMSILILVRASAGRTMVYTFEAGKETIVSNGAELGAYLFLIGSIVGLSGSVMRARGAK